jgi:hypothetical protein
MPTISNCGGINIVPSQVHKSHCLKLVNAVNFGRGDARVIEIDSTLDVPRLVVGFEAMNDTLVKGLDMCSEVGSKIFYMDMFEAIRDNMPREIVLEK